MKHVTLEAWPRTTERRTSGAHQDRAEGYIPGILLGHREPPTTLKVKTGDMIRILKEGGPNALVDLSLEGQSTFAMVREFTRNPVTRHIMHVDFQRVAANEPIEAPVQIIITGEPAIEYVGFVIAQELNSVHIKALPDALPNRIELDAATLQPGHPFHASDLPLPEGVELTEDPTHVVAILAPPTLRPEAVEEETGVAEGGAEEAPAEE